MDCTLRLSSDGGLRLAEDLERIGSVFEAMVEVTPIGDVRLLPEEEAAKWKTGDENWTKFLSPANP